jgi:hypothetical protein
MAWVQYADKNDKPITELRTEAPAEGGGSAS